MYKNLVTIGAALALLSLGSIVAAQAGNGAQGTPLKHQPVTQITNTHSTITEFSSSSAKTTSPHR